MPRAISARLLIAFAVCCCAGGAAGGQEISDELARWLLRPPGASAPICAWEKFTEPPVAVRQNGPCERGDVAKFGNLVSSATNEATSVPFPAPPLPPEQPWASGYSQQFSAPDERLASPDDELWRLPRPPEDDDRTDSDAAAGADLVRFAAGAIQFAVPRGWVVTQANLPREVRLYVTPDRLPPEQTAIDNGIWLTYHAPAGEGSTAEALHAAMARGIRRALPSDAQVTDPQSTRLAGRVGLRQDFRIPAAGDAAGFHVILPAEWGIVELHALHTNERVQREIEKLLRGLRIGSPRIDNVQPTGTTADAGAIVGVWKAERARLTLSPAGDVELEYDGPRLRQLDNTQTSRPPRRLLGRYEANGDVLSVTWSDGSRLNLRWRRDGGELLLTDHLGRVSQLARLFE